MIPTFPVGVTTVIWRATDANGNMATAIQRVMIEALYWHHNDHLGTPQALTDANGTKVWEMSQTPFGIAAVNEDPDGDGNIVENNFRFPGQYYDSETGLNYNYFRTYDPATGRYTQSDPIGLDGGFNTFGYVDGNPISYTDPTGLILPALAACALNPACASAVRAGAGAVIGGLAALAEAISDPCFKGDLSRVILGGASIGALTSFVPGAGSLGGAVLRGGAAGLTGNAAGQIISNGGIDDFSVPNAAIAGVVGATALGSGNVAGLSTALRSVRNGASSAQALAKGASVGSAVAAGIEGVATLNQIANGNSCGCNK